MYSVRRLYVNSRSAWQVPSLDPETRIMRRPVEPGTTRSTNARHWSYGRGRTDDVSRTVRFARSEGLPIALRGGAHSVAGFSTCEGGIVIDLGQLNDVHVDVEGRRAFAGGGTTWKTFDAATQQHGLATTGGLVSSTGLGGFTLGGGIGHLVRRCGLTCDNLLSVELVTADGSVVHASESENPELFWALRVAAAISASSQDSNLPYIQWVRLCLADPSSSPANRVPRS